MDLCVCMHVFARYVCTDIWSNKHENTPKPSEKGSMRRVRVSNKTYLDISLSLCRSSDVKEDVPLS